MRTVPAPINTIPQVDLDQLWTFGGNLAFPPYTAPAITQPWDLGGLLPMQADVGQVGGDWLNMIEDLPMGQWDGLGYP